jgi:hypothetical protein
VESHGDLATSRGSAKEKVGESGSEMRTRIKKIKEDLGRVGTLQEEEEEDEITSDENN